MSRESVEIHRGRRSSLHLRRIVRDARWLIGRAPEDGAAQTTAQIFPQVLKRERVGSTGEEISRPQPLTLLEIIPGCRPRAPLVSSTRSPSRLVTSVKHSSTQVLSFSQRLNASEFGQHESMRLMKNGTRSDAPIVGGQPVLVGAFGVEKRGTPILPATRVLRLIVKSIPSNKQQTAIKGDIEQMPVGGEWLHIAPESDEIVFWSSDDIQGCFHVFSLPPAWRRWMILSKPIRVAMPAGKAGVLASNDQLSRGGNAPQAVVSDASRLVWLALAFIPMGWLSAVGVIQHLHRNIISRGRCQRGGLDSDAELVRGKPFPVTLDSCTRWWWKVYVENFDIGKFSAKKWLRKLYTLSRCLRL